jgi:tetratricopeptide (TPR) repeat protein
MPPRTEQPTQPTSRPRPEHGPTENAATAGSGAAVSAHAAAPPTHIHRYVVREQIGRGGMGTVYRAFDPALDRDIALKLLADKRRADPTRAGRDHERIFREAQALAKLSHPNVIAVHEVAALRERLAEVRARHMAGDYRSAVERGLAVVAAARALDYLPLVAEASYEHGQALRKAGHYPAAQTAFEQAMQAAAAVGDERTAALAASHWLWVVGYGSDRPDDAVLAAPLAQTLAARVPDDVLVQVTLHGNVGACSIETGDYAGGKAEYGRALELATRAWGKTDLWVAMLQHNLGLASQHQEDHEAAAIELAAARDLLRAALGPDHPHVGAALSALGQTQVRLARPDDGLASCREAARILERPASPDVVNLAEALACIAASQRARGELDAAALAAWRALRIREQQLSPTHAVVGQAARELADVYLAQGKREAALELYRRAVAAHEPAHLDLVDALLGLARGLAAVGQRRGAVAALERAAAFARERALPTPPDAEAALEKLLWRTDRPRARALAETALAALAAAGRQAEHDRLAEWLTARR